ncbi:MAG: 3-hydroxyacyl-CoA dehydrogenase [Betaproteobacteria bacterium]|nr:3-hydroxyacyl-CoA dehydrogenase [Betaproteobacteria bacterium]
MDFLSKTVAIIGGGTMGADIAATFVANGWTAHIVNPPDAMRETLPARLAAAMDKLGAPHDAERFPTHEALGAVPWDKVEIVIEAAPERLELKRKLFSELERLARPDALLCSNSSAIPIGRIGAGLKTQHRMVGTHYFMPAHLVPAVEVVSSKHTDPAVAERVCSILRGTGKVPVRVKLDIPGFLANRMQHALLREAINLVERGIASPGDVDNAVRYGFGFRYIAAGPLLQRDHAGMDVHCAAAATMYPDLCNSPEPSPYMADKVKAGHIGMKAKRGFYEWTDDKIAAEKRRYETALLKAMEILKAEG